jgi:SAM-dependent methyltransferase
MKPTAYDFREFYASPLGGVVAQVVGSTIQKLWPDAKGRRVMVYGYGLPYQEQFAGAERLAFLMPPDQGGFPWPEDGDNLVALASRNALPLETSSLDGVVLIHALEYTHEVDEHLSEIWRCLKSNGRLIIIVPNRVGFWARADWAPFGHGAPFTLPQINRHLRDALFIPGRHTPVLFALPLRWGLAQRLARFLERIGPYVMPGLAGLHVVEATKQVYGGLALPVKVKSRVRGTPALVTPVSKQDGA